VTTFNTTKILQRKDSIDTKIKAIERKEKHNMSMREKVITKIVKKWLYKYHFSKIK